MQCPLLRLGQQSFYSEFVSLKYLVYHSFYNDIIHIFCHTICFQKIMQNIVVFLSLIALFDKVEKRFYKPNFTAKNVKMAVESCYGSITTRVVFTFKCMLPVACKDVLPTTLKSSIIYEYLCHCDSRYIGQTSEQLQDRIKQHISKWLQQQVKCPT